MEILKETLWKSQVYLNKQIKLRNYFKFLFLSFYLFFLSNLSSKDCNIPSIFRGSPLRTMEVPQGSAGNSFRPSAINKMKNTSAISAVLIKTQKFNKETA